MHQILNLIPQRNICYKLTMTFFIFVLNYFYRTFGDVCIQSAGLNRIWSQNCLINGTPLLSWSRNFAIASRVLRTSTVRGSNTKYIITSDENNTIFLNLISSVSWATIAAGPHINQTLYKRWVCLRKRMLTTVSGSLK